MRRAARSVGLAIGALLALLPGGCVSLHQGNLYPEDRNQVFVGYFFNETFYQDVEFNLVEQVVREINSSPGLHLTSKDAAEVLLTGRVLDVRQNVLSENKNQQPTSKDVTITVEVVVTDARTGAVLTRRKLSQQGQYVPSLGGDLQTAENEAYFYLARDIVRVLEEDF